MPRSESSAVASSSFIDHSAEAFASVGQTLGPFMHIRHYAPGVTADRAMSRIHETLRAKGRTQLRGQRRTIEDREDGKSVLAEVWLDGEPPKLVVYLQEFLQRPEGASGPSAIEVELGSAAPLTSAAVTLRVEPDAVLDTLAERFDGRGAALIEWARELPDAKLWSHIDPGEQEFQN